MTTRIGGKFEMPKRLNTDPEPALFRVYRRGDDHLIIEPGDGQSITLSEF